MEWHRVPAERKIRTVRLNEKYELSCVMLHLIISVLEKEKNNWEI